MGLAAFATVVSVFNVFLRVVPRAATGTHRNRDEQARNDSSHQQATECRSTKDEAH